MATSRRVPPGGTARDAPPTLADLDAYAAEILAHTRVLRARSGELRGKGYGLRQASACQAAANRELRPGVGAPGSQAGGGHED